MARRLLAVTLRVEHLPEGRRDGAHPRTHDANAMESAATGVRCLCRTDEGLCWLLESIGVFCVCMLGSEEEYCAVVNNSYSAGSFEPIYIPIREIGRAHV